MSNHHVTVAQSIREQLMLSAYRQGVLEARLSALAETTPPPLFDKYSSSQHLDQLMLHNSTISMMPQDSLSSQIEQCMLTNQSRSTFHLGTALNPQSLSGLEFLAQPNCINSLLYSIALNDLMKPTNGLSLFLPTVNLSANSKKPNFKEVAIAETAASVLSSSLGSSGRSSSYQHCGKKAHKKQASHKNSKRLLKKISQKGQSKKPDIHEDAALLLEAAVKLASSRIKKSTLDKSMSHYEHLTKDSELICQDLLGTVPEFLLIAMAQMGTIRLDPQGQSVNAKEFNHGFFGMSCRHCNKLIGFGSHFFKSLLSGSHSHRIIKHIQHSCPSCPEEVKLTVDKLCTRSASDSLAKRLSDPDKSCQRYLAHLRNQLVKADVFHDNNSDENVKN